jgi:hypothetical protein
MPDRVAQLATRYVRTNEAARSQPVSGSIMASASR